MLGSAILAGVAAGVYSDVQDGAARCVHVDRVFLPEERTTGALRFLVLALCANP